MLYSQLQFFFFLQQNNTNQNQPKEEIYRAESRTERIGRWHHPQGHIILPASVCSSMHLRITNTGSSPSFGLQNFYWGFTLLVEFNLYFSVLPSPKVGLISSGSIPLTTWLAFLAWLASMLSPLFNTNCLELTVSCLLHINYQIWLEEPTADEKKTLIPFGRGQGLKGYLP